ncbi:MAG: DNA repair protein RecN [Acidobacteriota bacterium]
MLRELNVRNLAVLAGGSVRFGEGLNVLTGETGAGKSLVVDSMLLLAGGRASTELIRTGADSLTVSGYFEPAGEAWRELLEEAGVESEGPEILVRREISHGGRNRVYVNDQPTTLKLLTRLGPYLLRIHGQRSELGLMDPELQRRWLDRLGGPKGAKLAAQVAAAYGKWRQVAQRLERLAGDEQARLERLDLLRFQATEIDEARVQGGEEDELRVERDQLRNAESILQALGQAVDWVLDDEEAASARLDRAARALESIAGWEPGAQEWARELGEARIRAEEAAAAARARLDGLEADPRRLDEIEGRLATLERLMRKYGASSQEILQRREAIGQELGDLEGDSEALDRLQAESTAALESYRDLALKLSAARRKWGEELVAGMARELSDLGLAKARLEVALERRPKPGGPLVVDGQSVEPAAEGIDQVVFLFAPNPGETAQPLSRIASGGELSRLSLALQLAARGEAQSASPTLVFDEVDTGVGGAQAAAIGRKLQRLAGGGQILAVTHLPQVASCGDQQFRVGKKVREGRTYAEVEPLDRGARVHEIARMMAGDQVTETSLEHAEELVRTSSRGQSATERRDGALQPS